VQAGLIYVPEKVTQIEHNLNSIFPGCSVTDSLILYGVTVPPVDIQPCTVTDSLILYGV